MKLTFLGAAREVTGSCYLVETKQARVLIDCGMFQGCEFCEARNFEEAFIQPATVDAVFITHAHLDHTGRLPRLIKAGFKGKIYATAPTIDLMKLVLEDAYHIMEENHRRNARPMLYAEEDVVDVLKRCTPCEYSHSVRMGDLMIRFREAGHIFGSAFIEIRERGGAKLAFSGDLGNTNVPILRATAQLSDMDAVVMESTYGNKIHEDESSRSEKLHELITGTIDRGGVLLIPAFAIERTQQLLYELNDLVRQKRLPKIDVYLDSPMAIRATRVIESYPKYYDPEALRKVAHGDKLFDFEGLHLCETRDESKQINFVPPPKVIISGAGMMNGGRILHHLVRYLGNPNNTVLIIGYQAQGTLGRKLYTGEKVVDVLGERIQVHAAVKSIGAYSAHADQPTLINWIRSAAAPPKHIFCTHGEEATAIGLATRITEELGILAHAPRLAETVEL
jgi:metallo-beta-lactamase family protein